MSDDPRETAQVEDLLARARAGDQAAEAVLFARLHARILALAKRKIWDDEAARDLAQETLQTAFEKYRTSAMPRGLLAWIFAILHHKVGNYVKRRRTQRARFAIELPELDWDTVGLATAGEGAAIDLALSLEAGLGRATPECRRIFQLLLAGAERGEIRAAFGGEPPGTVDSRVSRCRAKLLAFLEGKTEEGVRS